MNLTDAPLLQYKYLILNTVWIVWRVGRLGVVKHVRDGLNNLPMSMTMLILVNITIAGRPGRTTPGVTQLMQKKGGNFVSRQFALTLVVGL